MNFDISTLVYWATYLARADTSVPDPANIRKGWRMDEWLKDLDQFLVIGWKQPDVYAQFAHQLLQNLQDLPEMKALVWLAVIRGKRMCELTQARQDALVEEIKALGKFIATLSEGPRKARCQSLLDYHAGQFCDATGGFALAAHLHEQSARQASALGDFTGVGIGWFCAASARLKDALCKGAPDTKLNELFTELELALGQMTRMLAGSPLYVQWAEGNGPAQLMEACILLDLPHSRWDEWRDLALAAAEKLGEAHRPGAELLRALDHERRGGKGAYALLHEIAIGEDIPERRAIASLVMIRALVKKGGPDGTMFLLETMPKTGTQHVVAVANRLVEP